MIIPVDEWLVVRMTPEPEAKSASSLILPGASKAYYSAMVVASKALFKAGDTVMVRKSAAIVQVEHDGEGLVCIKPADVLFEVGVKDV